MDSDDGDGELIGAVLKAREARGNSAESLTGAWQRVEGQMNWIPAALCRSLENLHGDMSYVVIGGPMWKIDEGSDLGGDDRASDGENSTLAPLTVVDQSGEGTEKVY